LKFRHCSESKIPKGLLTQQLIINITSEEDKAYIHKNKDESIILYYLINSQPK